MKTYIAILLCSNGQQEYEFMAHSLEDAKQMLRDTLPQTLDHCVVMDWLRKESEWAWAHEQL